MPPSCAPTTWCNTKAPTEEGRVVIRELRMKFLIMFVLMTFAATGRVFAQIPAEWQAAAQAGTGAELTQGWHMARAWRKHNNGNVEIILAEYLTFVALCRQGCANNT